MYEIEKTKSGVKVAHKEIGYWFETVDPDLYWRDNVTIIIQDKELIKEMSKCWAPGAAYVNGYKGTVFRRDVFETIRAKVLKDVEIYENAKKKWHIVTPASEPRKPLEWFYVELIPRVLFGWRYWKKNREEMDKLTDHEGGYLVERYSEQRGEENEEIKTEVQEIMKRQINQIVRNVPGSTVVRGFAHWAYMRQADIDEILTMLKTD